MATHVVSLVLTPDSLKIVLDTTPDTTSLAQFSTYELLHEEAEGWALNTQEEEEAVVKALAELSARFHP